MHYVKYRQRKYNNKKQNGYDSAGESDYAQELYWRKKAGEINDYEEQVPIPLYVNEELITTYKIDFIVYHNDDTKEYIEYKGYLDYASNLRWKLFCAVMKEQDPGANCTMIKHQERYNWKRQMLKNKNKF